MKKHLRMLLWLTFVSYIGLPNFACVSTKPIGCDLVELSTRYSGLWYSLDSVLPRVFFVDRCENCDLSYKDGQWRIMPLSVGECKIYHSELGSNRLRCVKFRSGQVPNPKVILGPGGKLTPGMDQRYYWRLNCRADWVKSTQLSAMQVSDVEYHILAFKYKMLDALNRTLYTDHCKGAKFRCAQVEELRKYSGIGNKLYIYDIDVQYPDGTFSRIFMDTIHYDYSRGFLNAY
jgi:hypothetical protein